MSMQRPFGMHTTPGRRLDDDWSNGSGLAERTRRAALAAALVPFLLAGPALAEGVSASGPAGSSAGGGTAGAGAVSGSAAGTAPGVTATGPSGDSGAETGVSATDALGGTDVDVGFSAANALGGTVDGTDAAGTDGRGVAIGDDLIDDLITGTGELPVIFDPAAGGGDADGTTGAVGTSSDLPAPGTGGRFVVDSDGRVLFMPSGDDQAGASTTDRLTEGVGGDVTPRMVAPGAD